MLFRSLNPLFSDCNQVMDIQAPTNQTVYAAQVLSLIHIYISISLRKLLYQFNTIHNRHLYICKHYIRHILLNLPKCISSIPCLSLIHILSRTSDDTGVPLSPKRISFASFEFTNQLINLAHSSLTFDAVSYTHLDVYKRQVLASETAWCALSCASAGS